jgi:small-conductance mechanosensitive channel
LIGKIFNGLVGNKNLEKTKKDLNKAKEIMLSCANSHKRCINYPESECFVTSFNDYDITMTLYFWISDIVEGRMGAKSDVMIDIFNKFKENNIEIPFPQREVKVIDNTTKKDSSKKDLISSNKNKEKGTILKNKIEDIV